MLASGILSAHAQTATPPASSQTYAVISLIGEDLNLVGYNESLGTRINRNASNTVTIANAGFDAAALGTIERLVKQVDGGARVVLYRIKSPRLTANPSLLYEKGKAALPPAYAETLQQDGVTRLLLLTRIRKPALFQVKDGESEMGLGGGTVEGIGFFADGLTRMQSGKTGYVSTGYLAPYVSLHMALIDRASGEVLTGRAVFEATTIAADGPKADGRENAWSNIPDTEKIPFLNKMIERALDRSVPLLLKGVSDGTAPPQS